MKYLLSFALVFAVFAIQTSAAPLPEPEPEPVLPLLVPLAGMAIDAALDTEWGKAAVNSATDWASTAVEDTKNFVGKLFG